MNAKLQLPRMLTLRFGMLVAESVIASSGSTLFASTKAM
jgi:hypothetical protein